MTGNLPANIQQFNLFTGKIFALTYDSFPDPLRLDCHELAHEVPFDPEKWIRERRENWSWETICSKAAQLARQDARTCRAINTVRWLQQETFILTPPNAKSTIDTFYFDHVVLGHKGLIALNRLPSGLAGFEGSEETFGEVLMRLSRSTVVAGYHATIEQVVQQMLSQTWS